VKGLGDGQVWWADLAKVRPVVVLTRARIAPRLRRVLVAPVTTTVRGIPTEVPLGREEGVKPGSVANLDNIHQLPVELLVAPAGVIGADRWREFCEAVRKVMSC
jgi:mRNA interferase MazF